MTDAHATAPGQRRIWLRGLLMIRMAMAFHLAATLLALLALVQFVLALLSGTPNARLRPEPGAVPAPDCGFRELWDGGAAVSVQQLAGGLLNQTRAGRSSVRAGIASPKRPILRTGM